MKKKYKILAVVSARGGSKGIPGKNLKKLNKRPLLSYTLKTLLEVKDINKIVVSSDSEKILNYAKNFSNKIEINKRPKYLARDKPLNVSSKVCCFRTIKRIMKLIMCYKYITCPFIKVNTITKLFLC